MSTASPTLLDLPHETLSVWKNKVPYDSFSVIHQTLFSDGADKQEVWLAYKGSGGIFALALTLKEYMHLLKNNSIEPNLFQKRTLWVLDGVCWQKLEEKLPLNFLPAKSSNMTIFQTLHSYHI